MVAMTVKKIKEINKNLHVESKEGGIGDIIERVRQNLSGRADVASALVDIGTAIGAVLYVDPNDILFARVTDNELVVYTRCGLRIRVQRVAGGEYDVRIERV